MPTLKNKSKSLKALSLLALSCSLLSGCQMMKHYAPEGLSDSSPKIKISWASYATEHAYYVVKNPCGEKVEEFLVHAEPKGIFDSGENFTEVQVKEDEPLIIKATYAKIRLSLSGVATRHSHSLQHFKFTPRANEEYQLYSANKNYSVVSLNTNREVEDFELLGGSACPKG
ncbi:hypothetical protein MHO82_22845 [Vibrio sp. Of7-15]|uniref:hypothetical protein n=1 Tax=Vibrio sp. Of7-15 TaxID=2724879 RepID=UPI001EF16A9D|nr:hypothetical protein [Vibrio sp. Of7-15]MCG7499707.1 hypothetical protein [Vibrio sp. Of7-15]